MDSAAQFTPPQTQHQCNCVRTEDVRHVLERLTLEVHELAEQSAKTRLMVDEMIAASRRSDTTIARLCARTASPPMAFALPG